MTSAESAILDVPPAVLMPRWQALLATARPRQWLKNLLVVAAAGAAGILGRDDVPVRVLCATLAFCMLASGIYALNDVRDAAEDRLHPRKRHRPVAAGLLSRRAAVLAGSGWIVAGLLLCLAVRPLLLAVGAAYVALTVTYTLMWRAVPIFDLLAIAGGFVLRAVAGGVCATVPLSRSFMLVVTFVALLIAAGKRDSELRRAAGRPRRRRVLHAYSHASLRAILIGSGAAAVAAYCVWALQLPSVGGIPWRPLTIIPFLLALGRYGRLVSVSGVEAPEDVLLGDWPLALAATAWLVLFAAGVTAAA
jgi:decaprenyl-phosphate phosphoribosyltransferase